MQKGCIMCATKIDFKQMGFTEQQWNSLSAEKKAKFQAQWNAWDEATKDKFRQVMAEKNDAAGALSGDAIKTDNKDKGIAVELSTTAKDAKVRATQNAIPLEDNKELQKQKLEQYKKEYAEQYKKDSALANEDIADVLYAKDKYVMEEAMKKMRDSSDGRVALADRYLREFAEPEDLATFSETYSGYIEKYKDDEVARQNFNSEFDLNEDDEGYIRPGMKITDAQKRMVAHRKALLEAVNVGNDDIDKMASKFIQDRHLNGAVNELAKDRAAIDEAIAKGDMEKAEKLKAKSKEKFEAAKKDNFKELAKDKEDLIELMAEAKLEREIAEERVAKRQIFYSKDDPGYDKNNPDHKVLTGKMREFVDEYKEEFYDENGNFSSEKFKEFFVRVSNENETETDGYERADYMTSVRNRFRGNRDKETLRREKEIAEKYPEYANPETRDKFLEENQKIADYVNYNDIKAKFKDRKFQGACAEICGLDKEKDKLAGKKALHVLTAGLKGAGIGFAMGALGEAFACMPKVNASYAGILQYGGTLAVNGVVQNAGIKYNHDGTVDYSHNGTVGYQHNGTVDYSHNGTVGYQHNGTVDYTHNGTVGYQHNGSVDWNASGSVGYQHNGSVDWNASGSVGYQHNGTVGYQHNGSVDWSASGTVESTWEKWENGVLDDHGTIEKPWQANGTENYTASGNVGYTANGTVDYNVSGSTGYTANGTVDYNVSGSTGYTASGTVGYQANGSVGYQANGQVGYQANGQVGYQANGQVGYQANGQVGYHAEGTAYGDVEYNTKEEYKGEKEYKGTTTARHKFDWSVPLKAAAMGFVTGAIGGLITMKNVKYNGGGPEIEARKKVAERSPKPPKLEPIKPEPAPLPIPQPDLDVHIEPIPLPDLQPPEYYDYKIEKDPDVEFPTHEIKYKQNPKTIVEGRYGVKVGTKEYNEILAAMLDASGYERGTNLYVGDKFVLPTVDVNGKKYAPNDNPNAVKAEKLGSKARVAHLKVKVQYIKGAYYVVDVTNPNQPRRLTGPLSQAQAEAKLQEFKDKAEAEGKIQKPKE